MSDDNDGYPIYFSDADKRKYGTRPNKPPSQMTPAERKLWNAPDESGGYSKGGKVVAKKMVAAKKTTSSARKFVPPQRKGKR